MIKIIIFVACLAHFVVFLACQQSVTNNRRLCQRSNEVFEPCPIPCPPQICSSIYTRYNCTKANTNYTKKCKGECICKPGFYRNAIGECTSTENCLKCTGRTQYFSCGGACDNFCDTLKNQNQTNCNIINVVCNPMCYCIEGHARDDSGTCVPFAECPVKCPKPNEYYEKCSTSCPSQNCDSLNSPTDCSDDETCKPACSCIDGFCRNKKGICVPRK